MDIAPSDNLRLHIVRDAIRRRWPVLVVVVLIVTVPLAALLASRPVKHTASAAVLLRPIPGNALNQSQTASSQQITIAMETEAQLVTSPNVVNQVNDKLDTDLKPGTRSVRVAIPPNTEIIRIEYTAKTADEAMAGAQAFADQFMTFRTEEATRSQGRQLRNLNQQLNDARAAFRSASEDASGEDPSASAEANLQLWAGRVASLEESIGTLEATDVYAGNVVSPASLQPTSATTNPILVLGAAGVFALAAGLVLIVWLERRDDRIRAAETDQIGDLPVYALTSRRGTERELLIDRDPGDALHDAYRRLRSALTFGQDSARIVVITGVTEDSDVAAVVANAGLSLAAAGFQVTLVDASADHGRLAPLLGIKDSPGVADVIKRTARDTPTPHLRDWRGLKVLPAGTNPAEHREEYANPTLSRVLQRLRRRADYVLVVAPSMSVAEGLSVSQAGEGLILVARENTDTFVDVAREVNLARRAGLPVLATVLVGDGSKRRRRFLGLFGRRSRPSRKERRAAARASGSVARPDPTSFIDDSGDEAEGSAPSSATAEQENEGRRDVEPELGQGSPDAGQSTDDDHDDHDAADDHDDPADRRSRRSVPASVES